MPRASCGTVVKIQAAERGMTGMREAVVMAELGPEGYFRPHPYALEAQGGLPFHVATTSSGTRSSRTTRSPGSAGHSAHSRRS